MSDEPNDKARTVWTVSLNLTWIITLLVVLVIAAGLGRYLIAVSHSKTSNPVRMADQRSEPIKPQIPWHQVDKDIRSALESAHADAEEYASKKLEKWTDELMVRVDEDFLPWYFGYWQQQWMGLQGLWYWSWDKLWNEKPTMVENITENIQREFAARVLRPEIAQMQIERLARETVETYIQGLQTRVTQIPARYNIPQGEWERYLEGISHTTQDVEANRSTPINLKLIAGAGMFSSVKVVGLLSSSLKPLIAKIGTKISAKSATKVASKVAVKSGAKVAAGAGGKMLGPIVGIGILIWDVWDHYSTKAEQQPIMRRNLNDFLVEMRTDLLKNPEAGILAVIDSIEGQMVTSLKK